MGLEAATKALLDAGINYDEVQHAFVGYCYGDSCTGQRALYGRRTIRHSRPQQAQRSVQALE